MSEKFKRKVRFWSDPNIESLIVNKTCERCGIPECKERVAPPVIYQKEKQVQQAKVALERIKEKYVP